MMFLTLPYLYRNHRFISDKKNCATCVNLLCKNNHAKLNIWRHPRGLFSGYSTGKMVSMEIYCILSNFMSFHSLKRSNCTHKQTNKQTHIYTLTCTLTLSYAIVIMFIYIDYYLFIIFWLLLFLSLSLLLSLFLLYKYTYMYKNLLLCHQNFT